MTFEQSTILLVCFIVACAVGVIAIFLKEVR